MTTKKVKAALKNFGLPRLIIAGFLLLLLIMAPFVGADLPTQISNIINRFSWNGILVLAMVPMVHSGCGLNFGLPLGIISGLLGATLSIEFGFTGPLSFLAAILIATPFALILGTLYGWLLNKIKGGEMMIATYVGFSSVSFMCMMWLILPYHSPNMVWGLSGKGLRTTISLEGYYIGALANFLQINIGSISIPTGTLLFFALLAFCIWAFLHTKTGTAMTAVGSNPAFAKAAGINVDKIRMLSVIMSTWLAAIGILVYEQGFGFIQLYMAPFYMALPAVSAILIGGASVNKATIMNVIVGTILFQGIVTMTPTVMNNMIHMDMSEVIRIIASMGMILFALTRKTDHVHHHLRDLYPAFGSVRKYADQRDRHAHREKRVPDPEPAHPDHGRYGTQFRHDTRRHGCGDRTDLRFRLADRRDPRNGSRRDRFSPDLCTARYLLRQDPQ